jgi:hypothetical protein
MTATVAGIHIGIDIHANRPAANTVPDGSLYSCSTHGLIYKSNYAGNSWSTWATLGGVSLSSATPLVESGAGSAGTGTAASKDDHVHPAAGGGGGLVLPIDAAAIAAVGSGDLFAGTSLDGGWSDLQTTAVDTKDRSLAGILTMRTTGNTGGADRGIKRSFAPAGDFSVWCKILGLNFASYYQWAGLFVGAADPSNGGSGHRLETHIFSGNTGAAWKFTKFDGGSETSLFSTGTVGGMVLTTVGIGTPYWFRLRRAGSTLYCGVSGNGVDWFESATTTTIAFTVATCGLYIAEATATLPMYGAFNYIATAG